MLSPSCNQIINYPVPAVTAVSPPSVTAGQPSFTLSVTGSGFVPNASVIEWNGNAILSIALSVNQITATIPYSLIQNPGTVQILVFTPQPGGGTSLPLTFTINPSTSPVPAITSLSPSQIFAGSGGGNGLTVTITGKNFVVTGTDQSSGSSQAVSTVSLNGTLVQANFINSTSLQLPIPPSDIVAAGALQIAVVNPPLQNGQGGGASNFVTLNVVNPAPTITAVSPASTEAIAASLPSTLPTLTVTGTNLVPNSYITVDGGSRVTTFAGTQVATPLTAADLVSAGIKQVRVVNPSPGGGTSNALTFSINPAFNAGLPVLVDLAPDGTQANNAICGANCSAEIPSMTTAGPSVDQHGRYIAFSSISNNLDPTHPSGSSEIFLRDTCLGVSSCTPQTTVVSLAPNGDAGNGPSSEPSLTSDGQHAAFTSLATNLVTNVAVSGGSRQVYWEVPCLSGACGTNNSAALVSISADGLSAGNGESYNPAISPDGRYVAFVSLATNLVGSTALDGVTPQIFLRDTCNGVTSGCAPVTYLISTPDGTTAANGSSSHPTVANTGLYVSFESSATNLGLAAPNPNGAQEIFVRVPCLNGAVSCTAATNIVSTPDGSTAADGSSTEPSMTPEGRFIAFASTATNLGGGSGSVQQIYVRDTCTGAPTTSPACAASTHLVSTPDGTTPGNGLSESPSISQTNGQFVAFASQASNLGTVAINGVENIYVRNTCTGSSAVPITCTATTVAVSQPAGIQPTPANGASLMPSISADGHTVGFISLASNLVAGDANGAADIFLASTTF